MPCPNPMHIHGYTVTATATYLRPFKWSCRFIATKEGETPISASNLVIFSTRVEAEQQTLILARTKLWRFKDG
jgi:hypothetical protein